MATGLPGKPACFWNDGRTAAVFPPLAGDRSTDVAIVGAGIVGLTAALLLKEAGRTVTVLEARTVGGQVTGRSTAKVTSQHGLVYHELSRRFGEGSARTYALSNEAGLAFIRDRVRTLEIACEWEAKPAFVVSRTGAKRDALEAEAEAAARLGLPARFTTEAPVPYEISGAVRFDDQAQFNPFLYLQGLANHIHSENGHVVEQTRVLDVEDREPCRVKTDKGTVTARDVIVATNLPIIDKGGFFARAYPIAHMMIAAPFREGATLPEGMVVTADEPSHSFRTAERDGRTWLVAVGESFKTGQRTDTSTLVESLAGFFTSRLPLEPVAYRWMNEDYASMDRLPFIGLQTPIAKHVWVATGFNAWGITTGTMAGMILADRILGRTNAWAKLYDPNRVNIGSSAGRFFRENLHVAKHFARDRLADRPRDPNHLRHGEGHVFRIGGERLAVHRHADGTMHACSAVCTHLNCIVAWNDSEQTWDCPCHGSRFDREGRVIHGPAVKPLAPRPL